MDEYNSGMDPQTRRYLGRVFKTIFAGALWLLLLSTTGLFFGMALVYNGWHWYNTVFYIFLLLSTAWIIRYYFRLWKGDAQQDGVGL